MHTLKVKYALIALFFYCATPRAVCQEHIGDDMLNWVKNELPKTSVEFMKADYKARINNYFIALHQDAYLLIDSFNKRTADVLSHITRKENDYKSLPSLQAAILRQKDADSLLQIIRNFNSAFSLLDQELHAVSNLSTRDYYVVKGLYHIGRSTLFESLIPSMNSIRNDLPGRYGFSLKLQVREDGSVSYPKATSEALSEEEVIAQTLIIAGSYYFPPYGPVLAYTAVIIYDLFKGMSKYEELMEQQRKMSEAMSILPSAFPTEESSYKLYKTQFDHSLDSNRNLNDSLSMLFSTVKSVLKPLFAYNYARLKISNEILTNEKVAFLKSEYLTNSGTIEGIFNSSLLMKQFSDLVLLNREKDSLKIVAAGSKKNLVGFKNFENSKEANEEFYAILKVLRSKFEYIPMWDYIDEKLGNKRNDSLDLARIKQNVFRKNSKVAATSLGTYQEFISGEFYRNAQFVHASLNRMQNAAIDPQSYALLKGISTVPSAGISSKSLALSMGKRKLLTGMSQEPIAGVLNVAAGPLKEEPTDLGFAFLSADGSTFVSCRNGCTGAIYNKPENSLGHNELFTSSYDGAYQRQVAVAQGEVMKMKDNIRLRINTMDEANKKLAPTLTSWRLTNLRNISDFSNKIRSTLAPGIDATFAQYFSDNVNTLENSRSQFRDFAAGNLSATSIGAMELQMRVSGEIGNEISPGNLRPRGVNVTGMEIRRQYAGDNYYSGMIRHEKLKREAEFRYIEKRIREGNSTGAQDPVFDDVRFFHELATQSSIYITNAERCLDKSSDLYLKNRQFAEKLCANYLDKARQIRAYALGYLETYEFPDIYFIPKDALYNEIRPNLNKYATCNVPIGVDLEKSACNRYVGYALRDAYGFDDFMFNPDASDPGEAGIPFLNTSDLQQYIPNSAKWHLIGSATDQVALNESGFYASKGHAVIALGAGHVTLILPSEFQDSPSWQLSVPKTVMFALNSRERRPIFQYDVPLSRQWTLESARNVKLYYRDLR